MSAAKHKSYGVIVIILIKKMLNKTSFCFSQQKLAPRLTN
jgi:hypothetical protein